MNLPVAKRRPRRVYGFSPQKFTRLVEIGQDSEIAYRVCLRTLYAETDRRLDAVTREAREGKNLLPAADFANYLRFSGVLQLLTKFAPTDMQLPALDRKISDLLDVCGEHFRGGRVAPTYAASDNRWYWCQ